MRLNARIAKAFAVERAALRALPPRRTADYEEVPARVSKFGTFNVRGVIYSAPSRLIGHRLTVRLYLDRVEVLVGAVSVLSVPRAGTGTSGASSITAICCRRSSASRRRSPAGGYARRCSRAANIG